MEYTNTERFWQGMTVFIISMLIFYLCHAYIMLSWNPLSWHTIARITFTICVLFSAYQSIDKA